MGVKLGASPCWRKRCSRAGGGGFRGLVSIRPGERLHFRADSVFGGRGGEDTKGLWEECLCAVGANRSRGFEGLQETGFWGLRMPAARSWGGGGGVLSAPRSAAAARPDSAGL